MSKQTTKMTSTGPPNKKVIEPENSLAADTVGRDTADVRIEMDSPTPRLADEFGAPVHLDA